ncbi:MAG: hypothetical protein E6767_13105 [Dysgonomonas sp.]|nr:hypothetical protein [Dysgonomonas sp.]
MKWNSLTYYISSLFILGFLLVSCDGDDSSFVRNVEGHWVYMGTTADVYTTDPDLAEAVEDYIITRNDAYNISYEFKNDLSYYYYQNFSEPLKGKYKLIDKVSLILDDSRGKKLLTCEDSLIYLVTDMRLEVARELGVDEDKIVKAKATDVFERGLFSD